MRVLQYAPALKIANPWNHQLDRIREYYNCRAYPSAR